MSLRFYLICTIILFGTFLSTLVTFGTEGTGIHLCLLVGLMVASVFATIRYSGKIGNKYLLFPIILLAFIVYNEGLGREVIINKDCTVTKIDSAIYLLVLEKGINGNSIAREGNGGVKELTLVRSSSLKTFNDKLGEIVQAAKEAATTTEIKTVTKRYYRRWWRLKELRELQ